MGEIFVIEGRSVEWETGRWDVMDFITDRSLNNILEDADEKSVRITVEVL